MFVVAGAGASASIGALLLDLHRRAIFHQRLLLARTRDQQAAMVHDVTRTVTATLEIEQVLWRVCQSVLHRLRLRRLWLVWRPAPDGPLQVLLAEEAGERIALRACPGDPVDWGGVMEVTSDVRPQVFEAEADQVRALRRGADAGPAIARCSISPSWSE